MATLSANSKSLACYTRGKKGEGQEWGGRGITRWDNDCAFLLLFANVHLEWCEQPE